MIVVSAPSRSCWSGAWQRCESPGGAHTLTHSILKPGHSTWLAGVSFYPTDVVCIHMHQIQNNLSIIIQALRGPLRWWRSDCFHFKPPQPKQMQDTDLRSRSSRWWHHNNQPKGVGYQEFHHWSWSTRTAFTEARHITSMPATVAAQLRTNIQSVKFYSTCADDPGRDKQVMIT